MNFFRSFLMCLAFPLVLAGCGSGGGASGSGNLCQQYVERIADCFNPELTLEQVQQIQSEKCPDRLFLVSCDVEAYYSCTHQVLDNFVGCDRSVLDAIPPICSNPCGFFLDVDPDTRLLTPYPGQTLDGVIAAGPNQTPPPTAVPTPTVIFSPTETPTPSPSPTPTSAEVTPGPTATETPEVSPTQAL